MLGDGYYLRESVKQRILNESLRSIQKGEIETYELDLVRKDYLEYNGRYTCIYGRDFYNLIGRV